MSEHYLKTWMQFFEAVERGDKTFEVRFDDRGFQVGDLLVLREWSPDLLCYTGRRLERRVTYILDDPAFGVARGYVVTDHPDGQEALDHASPSTFKKHYQRQGKKVTPLR